MGPRGKFALFSRENAVPENQKWVETLKACLQCGACGFSCAAGVEVNEIIRTRREDFFGKNRLDWLKFQAAGRPATSRVISRIAGMLPNGSGLLWRMLGLAAPKGFIMPPPAPLPFLSMAGRRSGEPILPSLERTGETMPRISMFVGCVQNHLFPQVPDAILKWLGPGVTVPASQGCCGLPAWSNGHSAVARQLILRNLDALGTDMDFLVTGCASCAAMIRDWPRLFAPGEKAFSQSAQLAGKVIEFSALVSMFRCYPHEIKGLSTSCHIPCHQRYDRNDSGHMEEVLVRLFGSGYRPMEQACCGQGGTFALAFPEMAWRIFQERVTAWEKTDADLLVTTCSGCLLQLRAGIKGLERQGAGRLPRVLHLAELINLPRQLS